MKHISRSDKKRAWLVRIGYVDRKPIVQKWFYDAGNGKEASLQDAKAFVKEVTQELKNEGILPNNRHALRTNVNNKTGIIGVFRQREYKKVKGNKSVPTDSYRWVSSWYDKGKIKVRTFSESKYGYDTAKKLAKETRLLQLHKLGIQVCPVCCARMVKDNKHTYTCKNCGNVLTQNSL